MMVLSTVPTLSAEDGSVNVFWSTGFKNNGIVKVLFDDGKKDQALIAELIAIRYLLFAKKIFGRKPISGKGYELRVYSGAIKKIEQGRSAKEDIVPYGIFLVGPMSGVQIKVMKQKVCGPLFGTEDTRSTDTIDASEEGNLIPQEIWDTALGELYITRHAIEQYETRLNERNRDPVANAELSFHRAISPDKAYSFRKVELPVSVKKHKQSKYGDDESEIWCCLKTSLHITVLRKDNAPGLLVTCFYRD